jgi:hypothetical protein
MAVFAAFWREKWCPGSLGAWRFTATLASARETHCGRRLLLLSVTLLRRIMGAIPLYLSLDFSQVSTPFVTYASSLWTIWWGIVLGVAAGECIVLEPQFQNPSSDMFRQVLAILNSIIPNALGGPEFSKTLAICDLDPRLHHRAVSNALSTMVRHFDSMVLNKKEDLSFQGSKLEPQYAKWKGNVTFAVTAQIMLWAYTFELINTIIIVVSPFHIWW